MERAGAELFQDPRRAQAHPSYGGTSPFSAARVSVTAESRERLFGKRETGVSRSGTTYSAVEVRYRLAG